MTWSPGLSERDAGPDLDDDARALMAEDRREQALGIGAGERVFVGVADAGGLDLDQHLAGARAVEIDGFDGQRLAGFVGDGGTHLHRASPSRSRATTPDDNAEARDWDKALICADVAPPRRRNGARRRSLSRPRDGCTPRARAGCPIPGSAARHWRRRCRRSQPRARSCLGVAVAPGGAPAGAGLRRPGRQLRGHAGEGAACVCWSGFLRAPGRSAS